MDLVKIKQVAFDEIAGKMSWRKEKSEKYYHGERVAKLALTLREYILDNSEHDDIIKVAAWFHDCMHGTDNHGLDGAERAKELLAEHCSEYEMREIYDIIYRHDDRLSDRNEFSVYAKIQQDADFLDHFGTREIWAHFLIAGHSAKSIGEMLEELKEWRKWHEELLTRVENEYNFDISKKIIREKLDFTRLFFERFSVEGTGGIWDEKL